MKYQIKDIVQTTEEFGGRKFVIIQEIENGYRAISLKDRKRYSITDSQIEFVLGQVDPKSPLLRIDIFDQEVSSRYCLSQSRRFPKEAEKWKILAILKPGNTIIVVHRRTIYQAEFVAINLDKPIYPIRAKIRGIVHDFSLDAMILQPD